MSFQKIVKTKKRACEAKKIKAQARQKLKKQRYVKTIKNDKKSELEFAFDEIINEVRNDMWQKYRQWFNLDINIKIGSDALELDFLVDKKIGFEINGFLHHTLNNLTGLKRKFVQDAHMDKFNYMQKRKIMMFSFFPHHFEDMEDLKELVSNIIENNLYYKQQDNQYHIIKINNFDPLLLGNRFIITHDDFKFHQNNHQFIFNEEMQPIAALLKTNCLSGYPEIGQNAYHFSLIKENVSKQQMLDIAMFLKKQNISVIVNNDCQSDIAKHFADKIKNKTQRNILMAKDYKKNIPEKVDHRERQQVMRKIEQNDSMLYKFLNNKRKQYFMPSGYTVFHCGV